MTESREPRHLLDRLEELEAHLARGLVERLRLSRLLRRFPPRPVWAVFMFINGFVSIAVMAVAALLTHTPFVFPSLGPTAFLFFFTPLAPSSSPRNALYGHAIGILCGYGSLWLVGLEHARSAMQEGVNVPRVVAAALSLAATGALMILLRVAHPPAGATTMIISLGLVVRPLDLLAIEVAVALLTVQAIGLNHLAGLDYPLWASRAEPKLPDVAPPSEGGENEPEA